MNPQAEVKAPPDFVVVVGEDARKDPVRLLVLQSEARPTVDVEDEPMVMTFPHLMLREMIAFLGLSLGLVLLALFFDAPLEEMANPEKTPNPAKAPWYFLGLQELLHYYPPVVAGVLLPALVVLGLAIVPYFGINLERAPLWPRDLDAAACGRRILGVLAVIAGLTAIFLFTGAHAVWPIIGPLWLVALGMLLPAVQRSRPGTEPSWLVSRSISFWVFMWFLLAAVTLTIIGTFFRGPGWGFTLPWREGIY